VATSDDDGGSTLVADLGDNNSIGFSESSEFYLEDDDTTMISVSFQLSVLIIQFINRHL
jgi:hypothetical protein